MIKAFKNFKILKEKNAMIHQFFKAFIFMWWMLKMINIYLQMIWCKFC